MLDHLGSLKSGFSTRGADSEGNAGESLRGGIRSSAIVECGTQRVRGQQGAVPALLRQTAEGVEDVLGGEVPGRRQVAAAGEFQAMLPAAIEVMQPSVTKLASAISPSRTRRKISIVSPHGPVMRPYPSAWARGPGFLGCIQ